MGRRLRARGLGGGTPLKVPPPDTEVGEDLPDLSGEPSDLIFDAGSSNPVAFVFELPTAGAAF